MASTSNPLPTFDDDDGFDWESAIKEIDAACINQSLNANSYVGFAPNTDSNKPSSSRQSTLDGFFGFKGAKPVNTNLIDDGNDVTDAHDQSLKGAKGVKNDVVIDDGLGGSESGVRIDPGAAKTWIYPENIPVRDYQLSITRTALFSNTLVALPTGLGKTLIAAVVMYNYFRWFPEGKIVFAAPSRPLVLQQIEACHNIVGISQEWTVDLTGQTCPRKRVDLWQEKRIFFVTPQVLEKDIQTGSCAVKQIVCLVIDEAHRASGNYAYCVVVRELMAVPVQLRILALTATPGSDRKTIQNVIDNLQISSLEYRSETDHDVMQYVNDRKVEFIQVEMGKDALEATNLLNDVMRPYVEKLSRHGIFQKRDVQTLSPLDFLTSREKFRQAPPPGVPISMHNEMEGIYGILISLLHIRRLLSAHGIRPAFEMLEDKLKQGSFSRFMRQNETFQKARLLMQHNLSHGALSPKFTKLLEVLVEHFKTQDPQKSRVIIFSHYRESVRHIMNSIANIGEHVKATEFIGQSTGKTSKGQSQKAQQAVLEKFRAGGYNVIVATSIGEEGLDIMEVDLVISFDSNISPLRMIQRMGRTGRKNKGRFVALACEGSEVNGYKRKQAKGKNMKKIMQNGGTTFHFHSSPRMVPHVFRPEKKLVKFMIEEFIPRGKKIKDDDAIQTPKYKLKLTDAESDLLEKYFDPSGENNWKPSLIAFPHFQAFPSRVYKVSHSLRTTVLIDTMQSLQGYSFNDLDEEASQDCIRVKSVEHHNNTTREDDLIQKEPQGDTHMDTSRTEEKHEQPDTESENPPRHSFLFGSDFMSVDSDGRVLILSVPSFPLKQVSPSKSLNCLESDFREFPEIPMDVNDDLVTSFKNTNDLQEDKLAEDDNTVLQTENCNLEVSNREHNDTTIPFIVVGDTHVVDESDTDSVAGELSPRLTNLLISGVVPESPIDNGFAGTLNKVKSCMTPDIDMVPDACVSLGQSKIDKEFNESTSNRRNLCMREEITPNRRNLFMTEEIRTPISDSISNSSEKCTSAAKFMGEFRTPLTKLSNNSCSKDWIMSSGEKSVSQPKPKLKRLRKYGDIENGNLLDKENIVCHSSAPGRSCARPDHPSKKHARGDRKLLNEARVFIDDEAEVSSEASGDEEIDNDQDCYGGSFIDDRINPTMANTQAETAQVDMMAIYRRSLLTQSPIVDFSPDNIALTDQNTDSGSAEATTNPHLHTNGNSSSVHLNTDNSVIHINTNSSETNENRKRKLSFLHGDPLPIRNLEAEVFNNPEASAKEPTWQMDAFDDDAFYEGIDLDALEEQAAKELKSKSELLNAKPKNQNLEFFDAPSFDLGFG
uniref:DEAD-box ATP-dependent RNA helicase FANCM isoform X2 n=1 Tax=Tanacetum cinerariifolium TaxID=118510 RepID=A0A6L2NC74_TANCI|nr:DEAD-box ATP-dependent RNA helicase FANCM isoform X2 [Tanacetum cinerariifolium]